MPVSEFGRIGRDAELRYTQSGDAVCEIAVAVDYGRKDQSGKKPTQWYQVVLWNKQAEALAPYLLKGKQVFFTGSDLRVETFQKNDGTSGVKLVCRGTEIKFAYDGNGNGNNSGQARSQQDRPHPQEQAARQPAQTQAHTGFDDDIPF